MGEKFISFKKAAERVLRTADRPLSPTEIVEKALEIGMITTDGATPEATMGAQLYVDINRNPQSPFKKVGRGKFTVKHTVSAASSAEVIIDNQNQAVRERLREKLHLMEPGQFEVLVAELLGELGYEDVKTTGRSGDKGIDVVATLTMGGITSVKTVVQVKRYKIGLNISGAVIAQLRGSAEVDQRGLVITTSDFTKEGIKEASASNKMPVALVNGEKLLDLLLKHEIGVKRESMPVYTIDAEYFENAGAETGEDDTTGKRRALWPLPGGIDAYVQSLFLLLEAIDQFGMSRSDLARWIIKNFPQVQSEKTANGYVNVLRAMGFTTLAGGMVRLTENGRIAIAKRDLDQVYSVIAKNILGVEEIMEYLKTANEPQSEADVLSFLKENLGVEWTTFAQVNFRLLWLVNLGKIQRVEGGGYTVL